MTNYEEALARAQDMIDAAYNNALTYEGASKYGMARANALAGLAKAQIDLAEHLKAIAPEREETPSEASLGLLLRMLEDGGLEQAIVNELKIAHITDTDAAAHLMVHLVRGIVHAAPTEQRVTLASEGSTKPRTLKEWMDLPADTPPRPVPEWLQKKLDGTVPEGNYFPSYRDATYRTADYPAKEQS